MSLHGIDTLTGQTAHVKTSNNNLRIANYVWDVDTLNWIPQQSGGGAGPSANVVVTSTVGLTNTQLRASPLETTSGQFKQLVDEVGSIMYIGKSPAGTALGAASWSIKRITFGTGTINTEWAGGTTAFTQVWNNRASLSYS
jgi:hypothetical protein